MQGFDEFRDDDAGVAPHPPAYVPPVIGVGAGASVASAGAALLRLQFRQTRRTFEELMEGEVIDETQRCQLCHYDVVVAQLAALGFIKSV
jgi:hypothetical protein